MTMRFSFSNSKGSIVPYGSVIFPMTHAEHRSSQLTSKPAEAILASASLSNPKSGPGGTHSRAEGALQAEDLSGVQEAESQTTFLGDFLCGFPKTGSKGVLASFRNTFSRYLYIQKGPFNQVRTPNLVLLKVTF